MNDVGSSGGALELGVVLVVVAGARVESLFEKAIKVGERLVVEYRRHYLVAVDGRSSKFA